MSMTAPREAADEQLTAPTQQLILTHCLYDEGITRPAGFAVRATSTRDPLVLRFAQEYPPLEPPAGVAEDAEGSLGAEPLRRLALVRIPGGSRALIHSVPLAGERRGRANNFFSHVLVRPSSTACEVLRLWGSPDWMADCSPVVGKDLDPLADFEPGVLDDRALTSFLRPDLGDEDSAAFCPARLGADARRRRELLSLALRGCLLALREPPGSPRGRFFLVAEPRLAALLIYGAMRLLPPHFGRDATFSTYEAMRPSLRTYQHGRIVGTWSGPEGPTLEEEFFTTRGYAFDTTRQRCSPELQKERDPAIDDWLDLAAQGDWNLLDTVYKLLGDTATSVVSFQQGFQAAKLTQRLARGKAEAGDLVALKRSPLGAAMLDQHREKVWPLVRDGAYPDSVLREEFGDVLSHHVPELERQVAEALRGGSPEEWLSGWRLLKIALEEGPNRLRETLQRVLPPPPYPSALRFALLQEFRGLQTLPLNQQLPPHPLLRQCGPEDLTRFAVSDLPREWYVWALFYALIKGEAQAEAVRRLDAGDDSLLRTLWGQFEGLRDEAQRRAILAPLFAPRAGRHVLLFSRSLPALVGLRAGTVEWVLESLGALGADWADYWCAEDHLARLLDVLRGLGDGAESLWGRLLAHLDADLLLGGSPFQRTLLVHLAGARSRPGPAIPPKADRAIADHVLLSEHFEKACGLPPAERPAILAACVRLKYDAVGILRRYFGRFLQPHEMTPQRADDFAEFFHSFYPDGSDYPSHAARLVGWQEVVSACPEEAKREAYRDHYLTQFVPLEFRDRLAQEVLRKPRVRDESPTAPPKPAAEQPVVPVKPVEETPPATEDRTGFQLTGIRPGSTPGAVIGPFLKGSPWLLVHFAGGMLAVVCLGYLAVPPRQVALLCSFVPLILALADGMALQAVAASLGALAAGRSARPSLGRCLFGGAAMGAGLGVVVGALAAGAGFLFGAGGASSACIGSAVAAGLLAAGVLGTTLPVFFGAGGKGAPLAAGPIARALSGGIAVGVYVFALRWLVR